MNLQESGEMYLETIYVLSQKYKDVRAIDVGEYMGYSKPSVSRAVGLLKSGGYLVSDELGHLSLTESGVEVAAKIYERHTLLTRYLELLGVRTTKPRFSRCFFTSGLPAIRWMVLSSPTAANVKGIILYPFSF